MKSFFEVKTTCLKQTENGLLKKATETFLIDAMSFTEAEARAAQEDADNLQDFTVQAMKRSNIREVVDQGVSELWHKVKVAYSSIDDESEKEKKVTTYLLVNSETVEQANDLAKGHLKDMLVPYEIPAITLTPIVDVMEYSPVKA